MLNLITYFTTGEDESRAWTIKRGWTAPLAGTAIHTDFKDKFIRAEVIEWDKLLAQVHMLPRVKKVWSEQKEKNI
jgi:ribosome-binding ATPase YchF (GTP1/OBG family)